MYLSGGNATANIVLLPARNDVIWLARLGSPCCTRRNLAERVEIMSYYITLRETLVHKCIYDQLTRIVTVDEIKCKHFKGATAGRYCNTNATQMHKRSPGLTLGIQSMPYPSNADSLTR